MPEIRELIELLNNTDITELTVETDGYKICIRKGSVQVQAAPAAVPPPAEPVASPVVESVQPQQSGAAAEAIEDDSDLVTVTAPMVGTFYRAPDPEADPYVKEGDSVRIGQPLCIIEAMKLMNEIESEVKGKIVRILVEDGEPVEYGEPLFLIQPE